MPAVLALLSSLLWGFSDFLGGTATRRLPLASVVGISQLVALLVLTPVALLTTVHGTAFVLPSMLAGLVGSMALGAFYRALATGTMGVVAPIASLGVVLPVAVGLARGESPTVLQVAGIVAAIGGVVLASGPELSGGAGLQPLLLALGAAFGFGVVVVLVAEGSSEGGPGVVVFVLLMMRVTSVVAVGLLLLATGPRRGWDLGIRRADLPLLVAIGLGDVGANAAYGVASRSGLLSVVAVLASLYPVVTVLLARQLQAERLRAVQVAGVSAAIAGVVMLAAG